jgi:hypothetical protein
MSPRALTAVVSAIAALGVAAPALTQAATGTYTVTACTAAPGFVNHAWDATDNDVANISQGAACPAVTGGSTLQQQEQGLYTVDNLAASSGAIAGASAGYIFTAPANTTITQLAWNRYLGIHFDESWTVGLWVGGVLQPGDTCTADFGDGYECSVGAEYGELSSHQDLQGLDAHQLFVGVRCASGGCTSGASIHHVWMSVYDATVTLSDSTPPTIGPFSGPLASGGIQSGTQSLSFPVSDSTGIEELDVTLDGQTLPDSPGAQSCDYTNPTPCPSLATQTYTVNTTALTDGQHTIEVKAIDAAGLVSTASQSFTVSNPQPPSSAGNSSNPPPGPGQGSTTGQNPGDGSDAESALQITRAQVIGNSLVVTAKLPAAYEGLMTFTVAARHGRRTFRSKRQVKLTHGVAHVSLRLDALERSAGKLIVTVRYDGDRAYRAQTGTATVRVPHAHAHRAR